MDKIINLLINNWTKGVDTYTHNGSTWLIFTEQKSWVIELTESKTLWYNYNFFRELFSLTSMDVVENQHYITKWVEDNIINGVKHTSKVVNQYTISVEDTIENGVKHTEKSLQIDGSCVIEDTVQNGVKYTTWGVEMNELFVDDAIENGVKETELHKGVRPSAVESTIQNGVKETSHNATMFQSIYAEDAIQNGVKHTEIGWHQCNNIDDAIEYGVKETLFNQGHKRLTVKNIIENGVRHTLNTEYMPTSMVEDIIQSGVKETNSWDESIVGELNQNGLINEIVENGIKETHDDAHNHKDRIDGVIKNGVKETNPVDVMKFFDNKMEEALENGIKETNHIKNNVRETKHFEEHLAGTIDSVIDNGKLVSETFVGGIKETKTPGDGDIVSTVEWMKENNSTSYPKMIEDVIDNGVKQTKPIGKESPNHPKVVINHIIQNGTKNPSV